jgi:hypothetical protein
MVAGMTSNVGIPPWADLENLTTVREVQALIGAPENAWRALAEEFGFWVAGSGAAAQTMLIRDWALIRGDPYITAVRNVDVPSGAAPPGGVVPTRKLNVREQISMSLLWRCCNRRMGLDPPPDPEAIAMAASEEVTRQKNISDAIAGNLANPYPPAPGGSGGQSTGGSAQGSNVLKFKMSAFIDQADDSEVIGPVDMTIVEGYRTKLYAALGDVNPVSHEDPTEEQWFLFGIRIANGGSCYADLAICTPYGKRVGKALKFRVHIPVGDGRYENRELSGPPNFHIWRYNFRILQSLATGLDALSYGTALRYERFIEGLSMEHPECWALLYVAEDRARGEFSHHVRRRAEIAKKNNENWAKDYKAAQPWEFVWHWLLSPRGEAEYWEKEFRRPAVNWKVDGGRGVPLAQSDALTILISPGSLKFGTRPGADPEGGGGGKKRPAPGQGQGNEGGESSRGSTSLPFQGKSKRAKAKAKKRAVPPPPPVGMRKKPKGGGGGGKGNGRGGGGKGGGKQKGGGGGNRSTQSCFGWGRGRDGPCKDDGIGTPCKVGMSHHCEFCGPTEEGKKHKSKDCDKKPSHVNW